MTERRRPGFSERATVVLFEPQNPLNIGSVVRVCRNHDVRDLRLINPPNHDVRRETITAPHSEEWIDTHTRVVASWEEASEGLERVYAFTGRHRFERTPRMRTGEVISELGELEGRFGFVFGREDTGLPNEIVDRCHAMVLLESAAEYTSYNLAQAVLIAIHRAFLQLGAPIAMPPATRESKGVSADDIERMMVTAEDALEKIHFFRGDQRDNVLRTIRRIVLKADIDKQELATLWGIFARIQKFVRFEVPKRSEHGPE